MPTTTCGNGPVYLGLAIIFNLMIGPITPPMGLSLFMVCSEARISMKEVLVEMPPYFISLILTLALITYLSILGLWIGSRTCSNSPGRAPRMYLRIWT